jgi:hypothetical protein
VDWGLVGCIPVNDIDQSFCCVDMGSRSVSRLTQSNAACPIEALSQSFAFAAGASDFDISSCLTISTCSIGEGEPRSPVLISVGDQQIELTDLAGGVHFGLDQDGIDEPISWTAPGADDGFLVLDLNGNGTIDDGSELFGDAAPQPPGDGEPNGFRALAFYDAPLRGGNADGFISAEDTVYSSLRIWIDSNHDGVSQQMEICLLSTRVADSGSSSRRGSFNTRDASGS